MSQKLKMSHEDAAQKFLFENQKVRGVIVHLTHSYRTILEKHDYPPVIARYLGEILLSAALLMQTIKLDGRMTIQFQSDGAVKLLVAQINSEGHLRGLAQWDKSLTEDELEAGLGNGSLAITIFRQGQEQPMQSMVSLEKRSIQEALAHYFLQSEQLPTVFSFAVQENMASGFLMQMMPDNQEEAQKNQWSALVEHIKKIDARELWYDNNASFLQYYFPDESIRLFDSIELQFQCGCTIEKMANAISVIGEVEANAILKDKAEIVVTCEYCNHHYGFDREAVEKLFRQH